VNTEDGARGTHVFVDGFNFYDDLERAFGRRRGTPGPRGFNLPRLVDLLCAREGLPTAAGIHVFIGRLNQEVVDPDTWGFWRYKIKQLREHQSQGVVLHTRQNVARPKSRCSHRQCDSETATCSRGHELAGMRSVEKGIDVALAGAATEAGLVDGVRHFLFFTKDSDLAPAVNRLHDHFRAYPGPYWLGGVFPQARRALAPAQPLRGTHAVPFDYALYERSVLG